MLMFTLAISFLTTANLPWFMDLTFQVLMQYCSLQHQTLLQSPIISTAGCCFCFGSISSFFLEFFILSPLISSSILGTYWPGEFIFQCPIFLPFRTIHGVLKARIVKWLAIPFSSRPHFALDNMVQDRNEEIDMDTATDFVQISPVFVCMCIVLYHLIKCANSCNHCHIEDTEQSITIRKISLLFYS